MRKNLLLLLLGGCLVAPPTVGQTLTCGTASSDTSACAAVHYHLRVWSPKTKQFTELSAVNRFASAAACEASRAQEIRESQAIVDYLKRLDPKSPAQPNQYGSCHCDMTSERTSPTFVDEKGRIRQLRTEGELLGEMRELLLDKKLTSGSELVRSLAPPQSSFNSATWPKAIVVPDLDRVPVPAQTVSQQQTKETTIATDGGRAATIDDTITLVDVTAPSNFNEIVRALAARASDPIPDSETQVVSLPSDETAIGLFMEYESSLTQEILKASKQVDDDTLRNRIFEMANDRLQLLGNLRALMEGAGARSKLAAAVRGATDGQKRLALMTRIFGAEMGRHWAPGDARDVVFDISPVVADDPEAVLRDSTGRFTEEQRKLALFVFLSRSAALTSSQETWLSGIIESFL